MWTKIRGGIGMKTFRCPCCLSNKIIKQNNGKYYCRDCKEKFGEWKLIEIEIDDENGEE